MATAIDTSVLVEAERSGSIEAILASLPPDEEIYVPVHAAAEFLAGCYLAPKESVRESGRRFYVEHLKPLVDSFNEADADQLAQLNARLKRKGQTMKFYDSAIAATAMARKDALLAIDSDFDRLKKDLELRTL